MSANSNIEWTDHTFNPWRGCTKVSPGCEHCYAETLSHRNPKVLGKWGKGQPRVPASEAMWREPLKWNKVGKDFPYKCDSCGHRYSQAEELARPWRCPACDDAPLRYDRQRVFCASLADWLDDVSEQDLAVLMARLRGQGWRTAADLGAANEREKRKLRAICRASGGRIISGPLGYRLTQEVSAEEFSKCRGRLQSFIDDMKAHIVELDAAWFECEKGRQPQEAHSAGQ